MIYSKKFKTQKNELLFRTVAYNTDRLINSSPREFTFYKAMDLGTVEKVSG